MNGRRHDWLVNQLPVGMTDDDFLVRFVRIFQGVGDTVLQSVDNLPHLFDVAVTPDVMVRTIGAWLGLDWVDASLPDELQRRIVREYSAGLLWRGTRIGLERLLELICGDAAVTDTGGVFVDGELPTEADGSPIAAHVHIAVPSAGWTTVPDLLRIVRGEMPAGVTFDLVVGDQVVYGTPRLALSSAGAS